MPELLRLTIPRGWAILDNKFFDVDPQPEEGDTFIRNWHEGFVEDVLWIQEVFVSKAGGCHS